MLLLKNKINQLKTTIATAVEQILTAKASLPATPHQPMSSPMETEIEDSTNSNSSMNLPPFTPINSTFMLSSMNSK